MNDTPNASTSTSTSTSTPYSTVADIIRWQNEIERRLSAVERILHESAESIDALADRITYLSTDSRAVQDHLHDIAAVLRGEKRAEEVAQ